MAFRKKSMSQTNRSKAAPTYSSMRKVRKAIIVKVLSIISFVIRTARLFADVLETAAESVRAGEEEIMSFTTLPEISHLQHSSSKNEARGRRKRPSPIGVERANQNRALESLPEVVRNSTKALSSSSLNGPTSSKLSNPRHTTFLCYGCRLSTPPCCDCELSLSPRISISSTNEISSPYHRHPLIRPIFEPERMSSISNPFQTPNCEHLPSNLDFTPTDFYRRMQTPEFPYSRSKRLERMLMRLVDPLDTDVESLDLDPMWRKARTPISARWEPFWQPKQIKLGLLLEQAWYDDEEEEVKEDMEFASDSDDEEYSDEARKDRCEFEEDSDSDDGWRNLPTPISPLFIPARR